MLTGETTYNIRQFQRAIQITVYVLVFPDHTHLLFIPYI